MAKRNDYIRAESSDLSELSLTADVQIKAFAADAKGPRRFDMVAYTGGILRLPNFEHPVVVDLQGVSGIDKARPIRWQHDAKSLVGHTDKIVNDGKTLTAAGVISGSGSAAKQVVEMADNGFPWQASIGARPLQKEFIAPGRQVSVNGQTFEGPIIVARKSLLGEISFVDLGADDNTSARIAAEQAAKGSLMTFEQWLKAKGFELGGLSDQQKTYLQAQFDSEIAAAAKGKGSDAVQAGAGDDTIKASGGDDSIAGGNSVDPVADYRKKIGAEQKRVAAIQKICAGKHHDIEAKAVEEGWDTTKTELEVLRAARPASQGNVGRNSGKKLSNAVIEAALCMSLGIAEAAIAKQIPTAEREQVMNAASAGEMRGYSLHALMDSVLHAGGEYYAGSRKSNDYIRTVLRAEQSIQASGFTTLSLSGILSNVANKGLIASYSAVEVVWNQICAVRNHSDFKVHTRYRLDSTGAFKKVGPDGELKHIGLTDASYTNQLGTFGAIIALTRQMMVNDDLGAFMEIPAMLGRLAALRIEEAVFVLLLSNPSSFFAAGNANYLSGGSSALSITSLAAAEKKFMDQVDSNGKPILVSPKKILVGTTLRGDAQNIFDEKVIIASSLGATNSRVVEPAKNKMFNKYLPVASPYVDNTGIKDQDGKAITGQSATAWWMFADPAVRAAIAVAFLNGQQTPTIESAQTDFNTLGMQWRGFHDFGVGMEETTAAVMSAGA